ncbi:hypothetical protein F2Q70_00043764 [Brassica cretica]|uniref:Uncharacterized protein n=1 Tax=Brassica cretica TaxID=69181 RepID=A0A8S9KL05_BRACR|nr:hypothetical protein F2Q70_00043764 [Brassica cretica]
MVGSGMFTLLKSECDKIRAAPCEGYLRTLVEGIKTFVVHPGVEILKTCFPREGYELSSRNLSLCEEDVSMYECLIFKEGAFIEEGFSLNPAFEKHFSLSTDVRSQNCCSCLDANNLICDLGIRTEGMFRIALGALLRIFPYMSRVIEPKRFDTEPVRSQLWDNCLLGCDRGERKAEASEPQG